MIWLALGCLALGLLLGGAGMRRAGRLARAGLRPVAGVLAVAAWLGAGVLAVREVWPGALALAGVGAWLAISARRRAGPSPAAGARSSVMSGDEARAMLGVGPNADAEAIQAAYVRLMKRVHPDVGGASGLAAQLNAARETLLGRG